MNQFMTAQHEYLAQEIVTHKFSDEPTKDKLYDSLQWMKSSPFTASVADSSTTEIKVLVCPRLLAQAIVIRHTSSARKIIERKILFHNWTRPQVQFMARHIAADYPELGAIDTAHITL